MELVLAKDLASKSYILSGKNSFFYRFCDTGFKNKWCGFWFNGIKFLDYFAFKLNDEWLSPAKCKSFEYNEISASHNFSLANLDAKEFLYLSETTGSLISVITIKNNSPERRKVDLFLELGINIKDWNENWHERGYSIKRLENKFVVSSEKGSIAFGSFPFGSLDSKEEYKEHYPGGEKQRIFIPGIYKVSFYLGPESSQEAFFILAPGANEANALKNFEQEINSFSLSYLEKEKRLAEIKSMARFESNLDFLDKLFESSVISLEKLAFDSSFGSGYFAGYPWFLQFWGRDLAWVLPALVDYGNFEGAKEALRTLFKFQSEEGKIPNVIFLNGEASYNSADSTPLALIALYHYVMNSADILFLKEVEKNLEKALNFYGSKKDKNGFVDSEEKETWMDSLERKGKVLEIQAFWIQALKCGTKLLEILGKDSKRIREEALKLEKNFEKEFWNEKEKFYFDRILNGKKINEKTINAIFPLFFGISRNYGEVIRRIESDEFTSKFGIRTVSKSENIYNPAGYHTGSSWAWLIALFAGVEFKHGNAKKGLDYLKILFERLDKNCVSAVDEAWNSEDGSSMLLKGNKLEEGACLQAWSSLAIRAIDECMLGIEVNALENKLIVSPSLLDGMKIKRRKRIGNDWIDLTFRRKGRRVEIKYESEQKKEYKIVKAPLLS